MIVSPHAQNTPEWMAERVGIPTASNFDKIVTSKGEPSASAKKYLFQLIGEKLANRKEENYQNAHMLRGIELEDDARSLYSFIKDVTVETVGLCYPDERKLCGASPDGLVGKDGILEIKCPCFAVHIEYLLKGKLPTTYFQQVQGQLYVTERKWCDFMSYSEGLEPFIVRVERDETFIKKLEVALEKFSEEFEDTVAQIQKI
jgi:putative phage-type endonuclease